MDGCQNLCKVTEGTEFLGHQFQDMLSQKGIKFFTSKNPDIKCSIVERFNRTLKTRMWKVFTHLRTRRWLDVLPKLVRAYNYSHHRSIHMRPIDVTEANESEVWHILYGGDNKKVKYRFKFNLGDQVRLGAKPNRIRKGCEPQWTEEIFMISKRLPRKPPMYFVKDINGEEIRGSYYEHELQKIIKDINAPYWVEKVTKSRRNKKVNWNILSSGVVIQTRLLSGFRIVISTYRRESKSLDIRKKWMVNL